MRAIRRFFLLFFVVIIGGPIAVGGLSLVKDSNLPEFYETFDYESYNPQEEIKDEVFSNIIHVIADSSDTISVTVDQETVNKAIFSEMEGFSTPQYSQLFITNNQVVTIKAVWTEFINDHANIYVLFEYQGISTTMTISANVNKNENDIKLSLNTFKVGKVPVPNSLITYLLNNFAPSILDDYYSFGEVNYDELYLTILSEYYQDMMTEYTQDMAFLESVSIENNKFKLNFKLNEDNQNAVLIQDTLEVVRTLAQDNRIDQIVDSLDDSVETEKAFKDDFKEAMTIVHSYLEEPEDAELTEEHEALFMSLGDTFESLPQEKQTEIAQEMETLINSINPNIITELKNSMDEINIEEFTAITDIFFSFTIDQ